MFFNNRFIHFLDKGEGFKNPLKEAPKSYAIYSDTKKEEILPELKFLKLKLENTLRIADSRQMKQEVQFEIPVDEKLNHLRISVEDIEFIKKVKNLVLTIQKDLDQNKLNGKAIRELCSMDPAFQEIFDEFSKMTNSQIDLIYNKISNTEKQDSRSLNPEILEAMYSRFKSLWEISLNPPRIDHNEVISLFDKAKEFKTRKTLKHIINKLPFLPLSEKTMPEVYLGVYDEFNEQGQDIGEFFAMFSKNPREVTETIFKYLYEFLKSNPLLDLQKFSKLTYEKLKSIISGVSKENYKDYSYDIGRVIAKIIIFIGLNKRIFKSNIFQLTELKHSSTVIPAAKFVIAPLSFANNIDNYSISLKNYEEIKSACSYLTNFLFKSKNLSKDEHSLIVNTLSSKFDSLSLKNRNRVFISLFKYYFSDKIQLPNKEDLEYSMNFLSNTIYCTAIINGVGHNRALELLNSIKR